MDTTIAIKIFSIIPGLKTWATRRFSRIEVTPINAQGNNIFHEKTDENLFFVKLHYYLKAYTDIDMLDVRLIYGKGFCITKKLVAFNNESMECDGSFRMSEHKRIESGEIYKVFLSTTFQSTNSEQDYDTVKIEFDISAPDIPGVSTKSLNFRLSPGGNLEPEKTQSFRIF